MRKYLTIFNLHWQGEFTYRLNFILWRVRNVLHILMTYFLWRGIFLSNNQVFGYTQGGIFTYIFLVLVVSALVTSAPSADNVGSEIANGDLSNYLVRPISYLKYWFTRDLSSKALNMVFASVEFTVLFLILHPQLSLPPNLISGLGFLICAFLAILLYYFINMSSRFLAFWSPENVWPFAFLIFAVGDILGGMMFPLDILPKGVSLFLQFTPFPYLIYFPSAIFLGRFSTLDTARIVFQTSAWVILAYLLCQFLWRRGLKTYGSEGR